jgi:hypothetical protein
MEKEHELARKLEEVVPERWNGNEQPPERALRHLDLVRGTMEHFQRFKEVASEFGPVNDLAAAIARVDAIYANCLERAENNRGLARNWGSHYDATFIGPEGFIYF